MRYLAALIFIAFSALPSLAQETDQSRAYFNKANTQLAMNLCASQEATGVDAQRNALFRTLLSRAANEPEAVEKIKAAEADWIA
jgi:uncharacterized protein YecT (DUF1311 family)